MKEILFRAKTTNGNIWVDGYYVEINNQYQYKHLIVLSDAEIDENNFQMTEDIIGFVEIDIDTLGQYTGLKDKNGKRIFEGDIVIVNARLDSAIGTIFFNEKETSFCFMLRDEDCSEFETKYRELGHGWYGVEIIGNIHDNPELLKGE